MSLTTTSTRRSAKQRDRRRTEVFALSETSGPRYVQEKKSPGEVWRYCSGKRCRGTQTYQEEDRAAIGVRVDALTAADSEPPAAGRALRRVAECPRQVGRLEHVATPLSATGRLRATHGSRNPVKFCRLPISAGGNASQSARPLIDHRVCVVAGPHAESGASVIAASGGVLDPGLASIRRVREALRLRSLLLGWR